MGINNVIPKNLWKDKDSKNLSLSDKLVYRSRLLGADLQVTNFGGGNTSSKFFLKDPLTNKLTKVMLVLLVILVKALCKMMKEKHSMKQSG